MMVSNTGSMLRVLAWQWRYALLYSALGAGAWWLHEGMEQQHLRLPVAASTIIGAALGIFASFRANAAYARWWEGRQLWGRLVNASRMFASQSLAYISDAAVARTVVLRQVLYVHVLRCQLRDDDPFADEHVQRLCVKLQLDARAMTALKVQASLGHALQHETLMQLSAAGLEPMRMQSLDHSVMAFLDVQGGCERIKRTPLPRGYSFFVTRLLFLFAALFPFSVVADVGWFVIPLNLVVCLGFTLISETGRVLEDPFTHFYNSLPLTNMSVNIERNLRQRLGDDDLPAAIAVDADGILW